MQIERENEEKEIEIIDPPKTKKGKKKTKKRKKSQKSKKKKSIYKPLKAEYYAFLSFFIFTFSSAARFSIW